MQLAVFDPTQARHLRHFPVHFKALRLKRFDRVGGQLECQLPGKQTLAFGLRFEGFMQAFGAVLRQRFALGLGSQGVQCVHLRGDLGVLRQKSIQRQLVVFARWGQGCTPDQRGSGLSVGPVVGSMATAAFIQAAIDPGAYWAEQK